MSPATFITPELLRRVRLSLGDSCDAGTEHEVWFHPDSTGAESIRYFSVRPGKSLDARLRRFKASAEDPETHRLARRVASLIEEHHRRTASPAIAEEAAWRSNLSLAGSGSEALQKALYFLERAVERLRGLADTPGSVTGRESGLPKWFNEWVELRATPEMRADPRVARLLAEGIALSRKFLQCLDESWPERLDTRAAVDELRRHSRRSRNLVKTTYAVVLRDSGLWIQRVGEAEPDGARDAQRQSIERLVRADHILATVAAREPFIHWIGLDDMAKGPDSLPTQNSSLTSLALDPSLGHGQNLVSPDALRSHIIETDCARLTLDAQERPYWASRMWYGPQGLTAEVDLGNEGHRFTWVLPSMNRERDVPESGAFPGHWEGRSRPAWASVFLVDQFGLVASFEIGGVPFRWRWMPAGEFLMGSPRDEPGRYAEEGPRHLVRLSCGFWMGETPVTQEQWRVVVESSRRKDSFWKALFRGSVIDLKVSPSHFRGPADLPVESVSWSDCEAFCRLLEGILPNGPGFHLPTEAQWEYACRARTETAFNDGSLYTQPEGAEPALENLGWYQLNSGGQTHPVRLKRPNAWGLYDLHGNVWEWCLDGWYDYGAQSEVDPVHKSKNESASRVIRGGSGNRQARYCRSASRSHGGPGVRFDCRGFRLAAGQRLLVGGAVGAGEAEPGLRDEAGRPPGHGASMEMGRKNP
ncbi:MAG: formylglycine-generating enzyme family protein [Verrucomicrobiales bacterium]|nr:formylglycine-generating enzyme family protein [Verrucomicrobiales bacterium]